MVNMIENEWDVEFEKKESVEHMKLVEGYIISLLGLVDKE